MRSLLPLVLACACVDLGYDVDASGAGVNAGGGGGPCEEGPAPPSAQGPQVVYRSMAADPPELSVPPGTVVTWTNADSMIHTVVAGEPGAEVPREAGGFDSGDLGTGARWAHRFCRPRVATYFCRPHPSQMRGYRIVVEGP